MVPYLAEIDLVAIAPGLREVMLVSCKEELKSISMAEKVCSQFESQTKWVKEFLQTGSQIKITRGVACVKIAGTALERLVKHSVNIITSNEMIKALLDWLKKSYPERKGVHREPLRWLLQTAT